MLVELVGARNSVRVRLFSLKFLFICLTFIHCSLLVQFSLIKELKINRKEVRAIILKINTNENVSLCVHVHVKQMIPIVNIDSYSPGVIEGNVEIRALGVGRGK